MDSINDIESELQANKINNLLCTLKMIDTYDRFTMHALIVSINNYSDNHFVLTTWNDNSIRLSIKNTLHIITAETAETISIDRIIRFIQKFHNTKQEKQND